jgi:hypothetical protein
LPRHFFGILGLVLLAACESREQSDQSIVARDSAGVRIIESKSPQWKTGGGWEVDTLKPLDIAASEDEQHTFSRVVGIERLTSGNIVVAEAATNGIRFFDSTGKFIRQVGREGKGPGEFSFLQVLMRCAGDTLVAIDNPHQQFFDSSGRFIRRIPRFMGPAGTWTEAPAGISGDCSRFGVVFRHSSAVITEENNTTRWPVSLWWMGSTDSIRDSVTTVKGQRYVMMKPPGGSSFPGRAPWEAAPIVAASGGRMIVGLPDAFEVHMYDTNRRLVAIFRPHAPRSGITDGDRARFNKVRDALIKQNPREGLWWPPLDETPLPALRPGFDRMVVGTDGTVWLRGPSFIETGWEGEPYDDTMEWTVLSREGEWLGSVNIPGRFQIFSSDSSMLYGVYINQDGAEVVRAYRIVRK